MNIEEIREYCLKKKMTEESFPFDNDTLVFKVCGKMFLLLSLDSLPLQFNVKCDPQMAIQLREHHPCVRPGFHMNKKHWNTVLIDGSVSKKTLQAWIDHSYEMVAGALSRKEYEKLTIKQKNKGH